MPGLIIPFYPWPEIIGEQPGMGKVENQPISMSGKARISDLEKINKSEYSSKPKVDDIENDPERLKTSPKIDKIDSDPANLSSKPNLQDENT